MKDSDHEREQMNEVSLAVAPVHCLERISRPWHREGEPQWGLGA